MGGKHTPEQRQRENERRKAERAAARAEREAAKQPPKPEPEPKKAKATKRYVKLKDRPGIPEKSALRARPKPKPVAPTPQPTPNGADKSDLTMARSYRRPFVGIGATRRGNALQVTVTFTEDQFAVLKERADLYNASLSETIRRCVISGPLSG